MVVPVEATGLRVKLPESWQPYLLEQFSLPYIKNLRSFLLTEKSKGHRIYPKGSEYFRAFELTPFESVKVVILGQDPYHGPGQAHGLSFSVPDGIPMPPSLLNIYKEIISDLGGEMPKTGNLTHWANQGVLLLNTVLTVQAGMAASHRGKGWEQLTDAAIRALNKNKNHLVFLLWGSAAQAKAELIDSHRHAIFMAPHPSPLSAHRGFLGCRHFSKANDYLKSHGLTPIHWLP